MTWLKYDVFLSYSHHDAAQVALFVESLRSRGYRVFYDNQSLIVGDPWKQRLGAAIASSRVCILCWSQHARNSEFVAYEYSRAEGLKKPVLPWLLDETPLPQMIEIQGIAERDPAIAVVRFLPRLSKRLSARRRVQVAALLLSFIAALASLQRLHRPPPPWQFTGHVFDSETRLPLSSVQVMADTYGATTQTDATGTYTFQFPQPRPPYLHLVFAKQGYHGEEPVTVNANRPFNTDMTRLAAIQFQPPNPHTAR